MSGSNDTARTASVPEAQNAVRRAWIWLGVFVLIKICYYVYFEWTNLVHLFEDDDPSLYSVVLLFFSFLGLILFMKYIVKRQMKPALIYALLFALNFGSARYGREIDLTAKAYFFSAYPGMCPEGQPEPGYRVFLCYKYWFSHSREALVFNPGDEMAEWSRDWPENIRKTLLDRGQPGLPITEVDECFIRKTKHLVVHVYWVSDGCGSSN